MVFSLYIFFYPIRVGRPRSLPRAEEEEEFDDDDNEPEQGLEAEELEDENEEEEMRIPGMPSKPCPQCDERFTTRDGFLDHLSTHPSICFTLFVPTDRNLLANL